MAFYDSLTDFIFMEDQPQKVDLIFIPGGSYGEIALNAAQLYKDGYASKILISGKYSILTDHFLGACSPKKYSDTAFPTECDFLYQVLLDCQIPPQAIFCEKQASYTYENALYSKTLTDQMGWNIHSAILSCQAYHARRCLLYFQLLYPDTKFLVCPSITRNLSRDNWTASHENIDLVLGEIERCGSQFHDILKKQFSHDIL